MQRGRSPAVERGRSARGRDCAGQCIKPSQTVMGLRQTPFRSKLVLSLGMKSKATKKGRVVPKESADLMIRALMWKAEKLEDDALDATNGEAVRLREDAQFLRSKVSQLKGERIPVKDSTARHGLALRSLAEFLHLARKKN